MLINKRKHLTYKEHNSGYKVIKKYIHNLNKMYHKR